MTMHTHTNTHTQFQQDFVSKNMYVCASPKPNTCISKVICHGTFFMYKGRESDCSFVDIADYIAEILLKLR